MGENIIPTLNDVRRSLNSIRESEEFEEEFPIPLSTIDLFGQGKINERQVRFKRNDIVKKLTLALTGTNQHITKKYNHKDEADNVRERFVQLLNILWFDKTSPDYWREEPRFSAQHLESEGLEKKIPRAMYYLTELVNEKIGPPQPKNWDYLSTSNSLIEDYEGKTVHEIIAEEGWDKILPIGHPMRATIGTRLKTILCIMFDIPRDEYRAKHKHKRHRHCPNEGFIEYKEVEIPTVRETIKAAVQQVKDRGDNV